MAGFETTTFINRPIADVFDFIGDPTKGAQVLENTLKCEKITAGPIGVGTRFQETRLMNGQEAESELVISAYEPNRLVTLSNETEGVTTHYHYHMTEKDQGTEVRWVCELQAKGLRKALLPVVSGILKKDATKNFMAMTKTSMILPRSLTRFISTKKCKGYRLGIGWILGNVTF